MKIALVLGLSVCALTGAYFLLMPDTRPMTCESVGIAAFGDSLVTGYGSGREKDAVTLLSLSVDTPIQNFGRDGDTTARALERIDTLIAADPDIAIVLVGGNDALQRVPVAETEQNLSAILKRLKEAGIRPLLVGVIGGFPQDPYAPMFERLAHAHGVPLVPDILSGIIGRAELMSDGIHPNDAGYARIAERLTPILMHMCAS